MGTKILNLVSKKKIARYTDAKKPIYIEVKEIDVVRGETIAPDQCVMAKAACRAMPNVMKAFFFMHRNLQHGNPVLQDGEEAPSPRCASTYCLTMSRGAPPHDTTQ